MLCIQAPLEVTFAEKLNFSPNRDAEKLTPEFYPELELQALNTTFDDYLSLYNDLPIGAELWDLGSGHSKGSILFDRLGNKVCRSFEYVKSRVEYAKGFVSDQDLVLHENLLKRNSFTARFYYLYQPVGPLLLHFLSKVFKTNESEVIYVSESHGELFYFFDWLDDLFTLEKTLPQTSLRHRSGIRKYRKVASLVGDFEQLQSTKDYLKAMILKANTDYIFRQGLQEKKAKLLNSYPVLYNGRPCIFNEDLKRVVDFHSFDVLRACSSPSSLELSRDC